MKDSNERWVEKDNEMWKQNNANKQKKPHTGEWCGRLSKPVGLFMCLRLIFALSLSGLLFY